MKVNVRGHNRGNIRITPYSRIVDLNNDARPDIIMKIKKSTKGHTDYEQERKTGFLEGRTSTKGKGDGTGVIRVTQVQQGPGFKKLSAGAKARALQSFRKGIIVGRY